MSTTSLDLLCTVEGNVEMGSAKCNRCGETFTVRVIEDSPDINYFEYEPIECPNCNSDDTEFVEYHDEPLD